MNVLFPTLPLRDGETPASFLSRMAQFYRRPSAHVLASDIGLTFPKLAAGDAPSIEHFARLVGVRPSTLFKNTIIMKGREGRLRGQFLLASSIHRTAVRVCPPCIAADIATSDLQPRLAAYGRPEWQITHLRTCTIHCIPIIPVVDPPHAQYCHDFARLVGPKVHDIAARAAGVPRRDPSQLESYLFNRLNGAAGPAFLDSLGFSAAARTCELIGAVALHGRGVKARKLTDDDWYAAGAAGYAIAAVGEDGLRSWLTQLQNTFPYTRAGTEGPQAIQGAFYKALAFQNDHPVFDPIKDVVRRHVIETMPVGPGDSLFGKPIEERRLHSVYAASKEFKVHAKRLRQIVLDLGLAPPCMANEPNNRVLVDAAKMAEVIDVVVRGIPQAQAETYLNAGRVSTNVLVQGGYIKAVFAGDRSRALFNRKDLDAFLARLIADAEPVDAIPAGAWRLMEAGKRANCGLCEIVELIFARKLKWVGRLTTETGFKAALVDLVEIKSHVHNPALPGPTAEVVIDTLRTTSRVVNALIADGHLVQVEAINPVNRCPVKYIPQDVFDGFTANYVSLFNLMRASGIHFRTLKKRLGAAGVMPALPTETYFVDFYRRAEVERLFPCIQQPTHIREKSEPGASPED